MKIIGCGNPDRGDDQTGVLVSERLRELGVNAETHTGDPLALLEKWCSDDDVILVDAIVTGAPAGTVRVWDLPFVHIPRSTAVSSHGFDVGQAVALAKILQKLPAHLRIYGIEGRQFDVGADPSPEVVRAIEAVVRQVAAEVSPTRSTASSGFLDHTISAVLQATDDHNR